MGTFHIMVEGMDSMATVLLPAYHFPEGGETWSALGLFADVSGIHRPLRKPGMNASSLTKFCLESLLKLAGFWLNVMPSNKAIIFRDSFELIDAGFIPYIDMSWFLDGRKIRDVNRKAWTKIQAIIDPKLRKRISQNLFDANGCITVE